MSAVVSMSASMPPTWSLVKEIRKNSSEYLQKGSHASVDFDAVIMVVSELVENAVKYGVRASDGTCVDFSLSVHGSCVQITVKNGIEKLEDYESVIFALDAIHGPRSREELYRSRLLQIYDSPIDEKGRLGLYRIAYEGGFDIACQLESDLIKLTAWRDFNHEA
ncbi:MAG: hypothetical protein JXK07_01525 [Spirochaetes bacterium]|nr:hypothetical protein [Spirochaetota bacterium]MBN2772253.1 hypothetical protein [Spirochaetota bacterium]